MGEQAEPGWRSAADMQRVEAGRAETNVRRRGTGSPERGGAWMPVANVRRRGMGSHERRGRTQVGNLCYGRQAQVTNLCYSERMRFQRWSAAGGSRVR